MHNIYELIHINADQEWIDAYEAESLAKALTAARLNHPNKPEMKLVWINPELRNKVEINELLH